MVLFKRKPVRYLPHPHIDDQESDVWVIAEANEVFTSYDAYLERMDFFKSKKFTCEVSGRSGLTFFDALRSELAGSREIDEAFPQALREPVLRRVQFSTTSRIDNLVEEVYNDFKNDFYPGELVTVILDDASRLNGRVRDKAKFAEVRAADGSVAREAFSRYFVRLIDRPDEEALVDDNHIVRDRKVFTKQMLRSFIKNTVTREGWNGAPWIVKPEIAERFRIDTNVPPHLQYGHKIAAKKAEKKQNTEQGEGMFGIWQPHKLPELKPAPKGRKNQQTSQHQIQQIEVLIPPPYHENYPPQPMHDPGLLPRSWDHMHPPPPPPTFDPYYHGYPQYMPPNGHYYPPPPPAQQLPPKQIIQPPPPPPPIKYPIDDLDVEPVRDGTHRPTLKFVTKEQCTDRKSTTHVIPGLKSENVGLLLETWNTLNVYCQVLKLDSFTFDDFVEAMMFTSHEVDCELFVETHCAVLKQLVFSESDDGGAIQISLPDLPDPDEDEEDEEEEESKPPTPTPEPEYPAKRTRSSLHKVQFAEPEPEPEPEEPDAVVPHRAAEMFKEYGWIERLRKRDLRHGGWELVMVGLLHQLSGRPRLTDVCNRILSHLAPLDAEPTMETARIQYSNMDINLRAEALQIICQLFLETKTVKNFLEEMSNTMTHYRKIKIEHQRARKDALAKLKELQIERKLLAPEPEKSVTPMPELEEAIEAEKGEDGDISIPDTEDEEPVMRRSLRRGSDRAAERKRKREEEQERKEKAAEAKQNKGSKEYQKVLKQIEKERDRIEQAEEQILIVDGDLREADCPRTRVLGKDRFCNRYWWFERNAMPHGGLPDSSTADAEYANGRIWVQGPDDMEREGFIDISEPDKQAYYRRFQMTPAERKKMEEGSTNLDSAKEWAFYDTAEELDMLIGWLDSRGFRELKLKKELNLQRDAIIQHMEKRAAYLTQREKSEEPSTRMSTRIKTHPSDKTHRCLKWKNSTALAELGHRHIDPVPKPRGRGRKNTAYEEPATRSSAKTPPAPLNRQGKPVTRQGIRYNF
ncbi:uncharacterized protein Z520_05784 [Fonsecaea multimorphosa CBS 102226]|uniref:DDT domain-containing protein n=1 Tax=Fonsecaea multimorphosa CBS 102226 TaxID=1442371 RepID=A0A0D2KP76_9EURO|nr:uncharacterized protein Z520_05784 [Fonsecaea multimorphosa CBS 102226]KIX98483.1 hypothetical protein Z520_05784 [Fonsecaea multimorphosa CBS 102226]OAL24680.1 hypothetical protein AYO22_05469 [Fonsecaea multimorphosa]